LPGGRVHFAGVNVKDLLREVSWRPPGAKRNELIWGVGNQKRWHRPKEEGRSVVDFS